MTGTKVDPEQLRLDLEGIDTVQSPPTILQEILAVIDDPRSGAKDIQATVERDISTSLKLLRLANSAYYGFSRQVKTIREAIVIIGLDGVKNVAMSLAVADSFSRGTAEEKLFYGDLWVHSMATGTIASRLCDKVKGLPPSMAYCAGLIHDIGKVILYQYYGETYGRLVASAKEKKMSLSYVERAVIGVDHATVGGWVSESWDLPDLVGQVLQEHHAIPRGALNPTQANICLLGLADSIAYDCNAGHGGNYKPLRTDDPVFAPLGVDPRFLQEVCTELKKELPKFKQLLSL